MKQILDTKCKKINLKEITTKLNNFKSDEQVPMYELLKKFEKMFNDTLGNNTGTEYKNEVVEGAYSYLT